MVDWKGSSRAVAIGRLKVETRPMIMVEFKGETGLSCLQAFLCIFMQKPVQLTLSCALLCSFVLCFYFVLF